jgi:hypothetical protein
MEEVGGGPGGWGRHGGGSPATRMAGTTTRGGNFQAERFLFPGMLLPSGTLPILCLLLPIY